MPIFATNRLYTAQPFKASFKSSLGLAFSFSRHSACRREAVALYKGRQKVKRSGQKFSSLKTKMSTRFSTVRMRRRAWSHMLHSLSALNCRETGSKSMAKDSGRQATVEELDHFFNQSWGTRYFLWHDPCFCQQRAEVAGSGNEKRSVNRNTFAIF